jgi:hypothetical protein
MKHFFILIAIFFTSLLNAQTYNGPESIEYDASNDRYLISNTSSGSILARSANGTLNVFKSGISPAPYGLEILGNTVYACCSGFIKGFDLGTGTQVFNLNLGATFLNGITSDGISSLFATDFSGKKLYRIRPAANAFNVMAQNLVQSPNGVVYDQANSRLVFVNWGTNAPIKALSLSDSAVTTLATTTLGNCDGLAWNGLDTWYVSDWTGQKIVKFNADFSTAAVTVATGMSSPADIFYNMNSDTLAIPNSGNNTVSFMGFTPIVNVSCSLLPITTNANQAIFEGSQISFGDSVLRISLTNTSGLSFAYPLARITPVSALPSGMSFGGNGGGFEVFASAWNPDSVAEAQFFFNVTEAIPENTILNFTLEVTNLSPSSADTCFFAETFSVNLNPGIVLGVDDIDQNWNAYPNPSNGIVNLQLPSNKGTLSIYDYSGRCIYNAEIHSKQLTIGKDILSNSGAYHLVWISKDSQKTSRKTLIVNN